MTSTPPPEPGVLDIAGRPDLEHVVEAVRETGIPCLLQRDGETVAVVMPPPRAPRRRKKRLTPEERYEAFKSAAGSWADVDIDAFLKDVYAGRDMPDDRSVPDL